MTNLTTHIPGMIAIAAALFAGGVCLGTGLEVGRRIVRAVFTALRPKNRHERLAVAVETFGGTLRLLHTDDGPTAPAPPKPKR